MQTTTKVPDAINWSKEKTKRIFTDHGIGWRITSIAISLLFFHFYSKALFIVFMAREGFFSYDLFISGGLGMEVFFATAELMLIILSVSLFGVFIPIFEWCYKKRPSWGQLIFWGGFNLLMLALAAVGFFRSTDINSIQILILLGVATFIVLHIATVAHREAKQSFKTLLVLLVIVTGCTSVAPKEVSHLLKMGLAVYGVGGDLPVTISEKEKGVRQGTLTFLSPENVYLRFSKNDAITILKREGGVEVSITPKPDQKS